MLGGGGRGPQPLECVGVILGKRGKNRVVVLLGTKSKRHIVQFFLIISSLFFFSGI